MKVSKEQFINLFNVECLEYIQDIQDEKQRIENEEWLNAFNEAKNMIVQFIREDKDVYVYAQGIIVNMVKSGNYGNIRYDAFLSVVYLIVRSMVQNYEISKEV